MSGEARILGITPQQRDAARQAADLLQNRRAAPA